MPHFEAKTKRERERVPQGESEGGTGRFAARRMEREEDRDR